jgi:hypothetical protein
MRRVFDVINKHDKKSQYINSRQRCFGERAETREFGQIRAKAVASSGPLWRDVRKYDYFYHVFKVDLLTQVKRRYTAMHR